MSDFTTRLLAGLQRQGPLCVGLDPYPELMPAMFGDGVKGLRAFGSAVIEEAARHSAFLKPQIALFERHGPDGLCVLADLTHQARDAGLMVLLDAKRGDIGATASGYAEAYLGPSAWLHADAVTVNPYMGLDTLEPWLGPVRDGQKGLIVLTRTSNPGAEDFQALGATDLPLWLHVANRLGELSVSLQKSGDWSALMMVVGATAPREARTIREAAPHCPFLVPGYGAQGAGASDAVAGARNGTGVVVNSSRGVLYPQGARDAHSLAAWRALIASAMAQAAADLKGALDAT
jgi:orotidine-5'-phosphate decarboxylase